jgi:hypothetical protein
VEHLTRTGRMTFVRVCALASRRAHAAEAEPGEHPAPNVNGDHSVSWEGVTAWRCTSRSNHWASDPPVM